MQGECPSGWLPFVAANGKFIVGADSTRPSGSSGGRSEIAFEYVGEGQYRDHGGTASYRPSRNYNSVRDGDRVLDLSVIPPYVALRMCVKE